jgi:hypothetical protein
VFRAYFHTNRFPCNLGNNHSNFIQFRHSLTSSVADCGLYPEKAEAIFCSLRSIVEDTEDTNVYIGYRRISNKIYLSHSLLMDYMSPGNAAIIFTSMKETLDAKTNCPITPTGHYTCAWIEDNEKDGYFYFDSEISTVNYIKKKSRTPSMPFQSAKLIRVLFIFNLPLQSEQRQAAIKCAIANLEARLNGILEHCLGLKDHDVTLPVDFFAHLKS